MWPLRSFCYTVKISFFHFSCFQHENEYCHFQRQSRVILRGMASFLLFKKTIVTFFISLCYNQRHFINKQHVTLSEYATHYSEFKNFDQEFEASLHSCKILVHNFRFSFDKAIFVNFRLQEVLICLLAISTNRKSVVEGVYNRIITIQTLMSF